MTYTEELVKRIVQNHPRFSIKVRSKTWLGVVFKVLQFITRNDYSEFCTTVGSTVYVPDSFQSWPDQAKYRLLRHELVHVDQFNTRPFGPKLWWLNAWIVGFCYLLVLPAIWTLRAHWEREAYTQSILADHEMNRLTPEKQMEYIEHMGAVFGTSMYVWMWRREKAKAWTRQTIINVINGTITNQKYNVTERS